MVDKNQGLSVLALAVAGYSGFIRFISAQVIRVLTRVLIVRNQAAFEARHGTALPVAGEYSGALDNAGDTIILKDALLEMEILNFAYDDDAPWPECADGDGYSLVLKQPETNPNHGLAMNWRCSSHPTGNPGLTDAVPVFAGNALDDEDGDGVSALIEHFLGTSDQDASQGSSRYKMGFHTLAFDQIVYPTFEVTYDIGADDVTGAAQWSSNLEGWSAMPAEVELLSHTYNGDGTATIIWRSIAPYTTSPQFFRLNVSTQ